MKQIRNVALCLTILSVGLPAAADLKSIHGGICRAVHVFGSGTAEAEAVDGFVVNSDGAYAVCPLLRDRVNSSTSLSSAVAEVYIPSGGYINCQFYAQTEDGSAGDYVDIDTVERTTVGEGQMSFAVTSSTGAEGSYGMFCDMGSGTQIHHIYLNESGTTD
jgi:hypothetical protein